VPATAGAAGGADAADGPAEETLAVVRAVTDPDNDGAEFGIVVRSDLKGGGLGRLMMERLIDYQRARGTRMLLATALKENARMIELARELGFTVSDDAADPGTVTLSLALQTSR
jgi:acetyltransferase